MKQNWIQQGNSYLPTEVTQLNKELPKGIYRLEQNQVTKQFFLLRTADEFEFSYKIYGLENEFVDRVVVSFRESAGNLGILMNGVKGTGKTITAQQICNSLDLPVIIVSSLYEDLPSFLNDLQQNIIIFIDEYEKIYNDYNSSILTVMDGVLKSIHRKVFILTTNDLYINANMLQRPSRIRYVKTFKDLKQEVVEEIINDLLKYPDFRDDCIKVISELDIITIDLVKAIIEEVNIHNQSPEEFKDIFNIHNPSKSYFDVYEVVGGAEIPYKSDVAVSPNITSGCEGRYLQVNGNSIGKINRFLDEGVIEVLMFTKDSDEEDEFESAPKVFHVKSTVRVHRNFNMVL